MTVSKPCICGWSASSCGSPASATDRNSVFTGRSFTKESTADIRPDRRIIVGSVDLDTILIIAKIVVAVVSILV